MTNTDLLLLLEISESCIREKEKEHHRKDRLENGRGNMVITHIPFHIHRFQSTTKNTDDKANLHFSITEKGQANRFKSLRNYALFAMNVYRERRDKRKTPITTMNDS